MKTLLLLTTSILLIFSGGNLKSQEESASINDLTSSSIPVICTPELEDLILSWASEYAVANPGINVSVTVVPEIAPVLANTGNLGFTSSPIPVSGDHPMLWKIPVGHDVIVPIINSGNPFQEALYERGISKETLLLMFKNPESQYWGTLAGNESKVPIRFYISDEEIVKTGLHKFLSMNYIPQEGIVWTSPAKLASAVQKDPYAIGFCNLAIVVDPQSNSLTGNISLLPIDRDGNGRIDHRENIYGNLNDFARGVWIGKFPKALSHEIYSVSAEQPSNDAELAFLNWIITDGQQLLALRGHTDLISSERLSTLNKINNVNVYAPPVKDISTMPKLAMVILASLLVVSLTVSIIIRYFKKDITKLQVEVPAFAPGVFNESSVDVPKGLHYDRTHIWAFMEKDGSVRVGVDDFLQHVLGFVTRVEMKKPGEKIKKGDPLVTLIQDGKQLRLYSPVSGTIKKQNELLNTDASRIKKSPYYDGWVYMIEPADWMKESRLLSMADKYLKWVPEELARLKDFLSSALNTADLKYARVVLQDGGELQENILSELGPEIWEDFQSDFLDKSK